MSTDGSSNAIPPQEKKERPTAAKLRFSNGLKQLEGYLIG